MSPQFVLPVSLDRQAAANLTLVRLDEGDIAAAHAAVDLAREIGLVSAEFDEIVRLVEAAECSNEEVASH